MTKRYLVCVLVAFAMGCDDDADEGGTDAGSATGSADAEAFLADAGTRGEVDTGAGTDAATGDHDDPAEPFCTGFRDTCGFEGEDRFGSIAECHVFYDGVSAERQACVELHLEMAAGDPGTHCPHATGLAPCD